MRTLIVAALLLTGCDGGAEPSVEPDPFDEAQTCDELFAIFDAMPVSDDPDVRKQVGDQYRARFRELGCGP